MRTIHLQRSRQGFTLVELMITVALIGVLAAIAIPSFVSYQARVRRSESFSVLSGIATSYLSFYSERGYYPDMLIEKGKTNLPDVAPSPKKEKWDDPDPAVVDAQSFFDIVGYEVDGDVWHTYDVSTPANGARCTNAGAGCSNCFTLTAHGDTDGDGLLGAVMYAHPERAANGNIVDWCHSLLFNYSPPAGAWDQPVVKIAGPDDY